MVTTLQECELYTALSHWLTANNHPSSYRILVDFPAFGHTDLVDKIEWRMAPPVLPTAQDMVNSYNAYLTLQTKQEQSVTVEAGAKTQAASIPNWATWTEAQALAWHDANIGNAIAPIANLADAKAVLAQVAAENRALVRMVLALRNKTFSDLQGG